ncbi:MAG: response regulator transcription factor [Clostridia bacterium]|nr:response regulator transcription factor [Clostridia bacterium]
MKLNIAICDDEQNHICALAELVRKWEMCHSHQVKIQEFSSAEAFLFEYSENHDFDILLLDIEMDGMNGVELARTLRKENDNLQIVFVTGYDDYIADGYDVAALHYLMKPLKEEKLMSVLDRAVRLISDREKNILLNVGGIVLKLPLDKIMYIEAQQNYIVIYTEKDEYRVKRTLSSIEKELDNGFFRTGRSYIVGLRYVASISKTEIKLDNGTVIPLGRGLFDAANKAFIAFY